MRAGGLLVIALAIAALLHSRRKPNEDAGDQRPDSDQFPHVLSGAEGFLLSSLPSAEDGRGARTCVPALYSDIEDDGFVTVFPINNEGRN